MDSQFPPRRPAAAPQTSKTADWWRQAAVYRIYPRSFADVNHDGLGDLPGVTSRIGYLKELGIDAIWLSPLHPSALADGGYDVDDHRNVDARLGTLEDFDAMVDAAHGAGLKVIVDVVPNHSSNRHRWFGAALAAAPGSPERARYQFHEGLGERGNCRPRIGPRTLAAPPGPASPKTPGPTPGSRASGTCIYSPANGRT